MKYIHKHGGYSTILILILIGFLMVMITGVFNLVMRELQANRYMGDALKAFAAAEAGQELALLKIKKHGYGFYQKLDFATNGESMVLSQNSTGTSYNKKRDVLVSYDIGSKVSQYNGILETNQHHIIPLFYIDQSDVEYKVNSIDVDIISGNSGDFVWNVVSNTSGIGGVGENEQGVSKTYAGSSLNLSQNHNRNSFLSSHDTNYLVLYNAGTSGNIEYTLSSQNGEFFSKPETTIISSAKIGSVRQNLSTYLDNTKYLGILKYVIYNN